VDGDVDVVLLDRRMPGKSGEEVAEAIEERGLDCVVAVASAAPPEQDVLSLPCDAYLEKPVVGRELEDWIERLSRRRRYEPEVREFAALVSKVRAVRVADGCPWGEDGAVAEAEASLVELASDLFDDVDGQDLSEIEGDLELDFLDLP
jgi:DNA-binding response OmpR family regulator